MLFVILTFKISLIKTIETEFYILSIYFSATAMSKTYTTFMSFFSSCIKVPINYRAILVFIKLKKSIS